MTQEEFQNNVLPLKNKLYCFALSILKNKEDARDVVQDTMLKIWQNNKALDEYKNIEAWCMTMTRNRSLDKLKLKSNRHERVEDQFDQAVDQQDPSQVLAQKDMMKHLNKLVEELPDKQRQVIHLRDFQGYSYKEIAEVMDVDMNLVKVSLHRARTTLKKQLLKISSYGMQSI